MSNVVNLSKLKVKKLTQDDMLKMINNINKSINELDFDKAIKLQAECQRKYLEQNNETTES
ncbi:MAG: hypothetical protein BMS9Abin31_0489 [Gammaproteobacteria bacterium]|nr:MAG: hypothetical protein BMS9Abin31_0489 [Gammaproteobacteria bacterium]